MYTSSECSGTIVQDFVHDILVEKKAKIESIQSRTTPDPGHHMGK